MTLLGDESVAKRVGVHCMKVLDFHRSVVEKIEAPEEDVNSTEARPVS